MPLAAQTPAAAPASQNGSSTTLSVAVAGAAKATGDDATDSPRATLHVYTNLMQVPVLILSSDHGHLGAIPESKFRIRLDSGPPFKPTHVRREGDDPIELAVLIDVSRRENELLPGISEAVSALVPGSLRPWDHVSVYVMDCGVIRTAYDLPADQAKLRETIDRGMAGWQDRRHQKHVPACRSGVLLFDAMTFVTNDLASLQGRRVMLVLTDGLDHGSRTNWNRLSRFEQMTSTAVFGLRSRQQMDDEHLAGFDYRQNPLLAATSQASVRSEDQFDIICQSSGGVEFALGDHGLARGLVRFVEMLRERYIVEYPRSNTATAGIHDLLVTVPDVFAYVRPSGTSVPLADRKLLENPLTLPSQADVPVEGPRRVIGEGSPRPAAVPSPQ